MPQLPQLPTDPKEVKILPAGVYRTVVTLREEYRFRDPLLGDQKCWAYRLAVPSYKTVLFAYAYDSFDVGMSVSAAVVHRRSPGGKVYAVVTRIREIQPGKGDPKFAH